LVNLYAHLCSHTETAAPFGATGEKKIKSIFDFVFKLRAFAPYTVKWF